MSDKRPIGLLDSGVGGLTVVEEVIKKLPHEDIVFIGDEAHMPYGVRPASEIIKYTREMVEFLISQNVKAIIYACNTATARALSTLEKEFDVPMFGVIKSGAQSAVADTKTDDIGVIGTESTVNSGSYPETIAKVDDKIKVHSIAAQHFVKIVESDAADTDASKEDIAQTLAPLKETNIDTLILGCTHFPMLEKQIQAFMGESVKLVDPGIETTNVVKKYLSSEAMLTDNQQSGKVELNTTANLDSFKALAKDWLGSGISEINLIRIGD
ncbi:glutamate racemase [Companilactobacillus zhongbaensis]|uniref:glutamate racemase n=1 Tax=Companilactobacillus zhongbaensis TaxID=2486009 RepID=UPI000F79742D|nr:glutamate racemase [Companilactobacillus zhongbaensis]